MASETGVLASIDALGGELGIVRMCSYRMLCFDCLYRVVWRRVFAPGKNGHIDAVLRTQGGCECKLQ